MLVRLGLAIRRARDERDISQETLAADSHIDRAYMGHIERGNQNIGVIHLHRIATALQMTVTELMMEAEL